MFIKNAQGSPNSEKSVPTMLDLNRSFTEYFELTS